MDFPEDRRYTKDHEWAQHEDGGATIGISEFAQEELGEIVFVELPAVGARFAAGDTLCVVESTKAASDVYAPVSGVVSAVNDALNDQPDLVNTSPYQDGWMVKFSEVKSEEVESLFDHVAYQEIAK
ncbi:glycine cleavage system protein GcvH [bacterium]|nr:glycine cleavage system protein GcvH [bacterium]